MITEDGRMFCDECGREVTMLCSYDDDGWFWCNECIEEIDLYFNLEKVGKYCLYPDGQARVWIANERVVRYWAVMAWEAQARLGEEPVRVMSRLADRDEVVAREFSYQMAEHTIDD